LRIKPSLYKFAGITALAMLVLAATSEGVISRDLVAALAISLSAAALAASLLALRRGKDIQRSAQDYFAKIENATRRLERDRLVTEKDAPAPTATAMRRAPDSAKQADAANAPRLAPGLRPMVIEGGKAKAERLSAEMSATDDALLVALDTHALAVSLEPVVELQSSRVVAYRVHAHVTTADGISVHLRRLEGSHPGIDPARFDMELFHSAAAAARRFPGASADETPLICPLSGAALGSPKDMRKIVAMMNNLPGLKSALVLEMPSDTLVSDDVFLSGPGLLADSAIRLAVEGSLEARRMKEVFGRLDIEFWSIRGADIIAEGAGGFMLSASSASSAKVIATALAQDHEVVEMIDCGVALVCGPRFCEPKQVKTPGSDTHPDRDRAGRLF
jgi:hypothetical protein